ncbi:hypothetical protein RHMOL_Rhmol06G0206900 [Rhododendron molle]|uniref:Uncharacterized protein n=1 Tax=Rhododendron molle TaxID=49168 RepID=A0ACC0NEC0_RHOML|nr:hypothetical protein RHMOL_Rhmol06G0206900 [Rhododendron molle]
MWLDANMNYMREPTVQQSPIPKLDELLAKETSGEMYVDSSNSFHEVDSWVEDSASPELHQELNSTTMGLAGIGAHNARVKTLEEEDIFDQEKDIGKGLGSFGDQVIFQSQDDLRATQVEGINLQVDLNPSKGCHSKD